MRKLVLCNLLFLILLSTIVQGQHLKFHCTERNKNNPGFKDSIIVQTCYLNNFKFVTRSIPDDVGRYYYSEHEVYMHTPKGYVKTTNSKVFNQSQNLLVAEINRRIQEDFKKFSTDTSTKICFTNIDSIPTYKMDDFDISFYGNEIWFQVHWNLMTVCRAVDGTVVSFNINDIKKYLK